MDGLAYIAFSGLLNIVIRPLGGYIGDVIYRFYGNKGKKAWIIFCVFVMGATILAGGLYLQSGTIWRCEPYVQFLSLLKSTIKILIFFRSPMGVFSLTLIFSELGNGACFALVPHLPHNVRCSLYLSIGLD